jgi:diguanylate cyclase (GGDEF)-like protein
MELTLRFLDYLDRQSRAAVWSMVVALLVGLGIIDYFSGAQITIVFFYLLPVSLASWRLGAYSAGLVALACAITMQVANPLVGEALSNPGVIIWDTLTRLAILVTFAAVLRQLRVLLDQQTTLARRDPLTGVLNRRAFFEEAIVEVARLRRHKRPLTFMFFDLDDFKALNDSRGHLTGDKVLKSIAEHVEQQLRGTDIIGRMGGDEFAALLPEVSAAAAHQMIPRLQTSLSGEMARLGWPVNFSIGVLTCVSAPRDAEVAFGFADQLMYAAKARGGNCVQYAVFPDEQKTVPMRRRDQS